MFVVFGFYKFQKINDLKKNQKILSNLLNNRNINGSIIISKEGLNGSISGMNKDIKTTIIRLKKILNIGKNLNGYILILDLLNLNFRKVKLKKIKSV